MSDTKTQYEIAKCVEEFLARRDSRTRDPDLNKLIEEYNRKQSRHVFFTPVKDGRNAVLSSIRAWSKWAMEKGLIKPKKDLLAQNIVDFRPALDGLNLNPDDLPAIHFTDAEMDLIKKHWQVILPPFMTGTLTANKGRYYDYTVTKVTENGYSITTTDYERFNGTWIPICYATGDVYISANEESPIKANYKGLTFPEIMITGIPDSEWNDDELQMLKIVTIPYMLSFTLSEDVGDSFGRFALIMAKTGVKLNGKRHTKHQPVAAEKKSRIVKAEKGDVSQCSLPKIIWAKPIISPKDDEQEGANVCDIPEEEFNEQRGSVPPIIRKYTTQSWFTMGHLRHYKSGKVAWIKPSLHKRKCLLNEDVTSARQTVVKVAPDKLRDEA